MKFVIITFIFILTAPLSALTKEHCSKYSWNGCLDASLEKNQHEPVRTPTPTPTPSRSLSPNDPKMPNFRSFVEKMLREKYKQELQNICPIDTDTVAERVFREYGAIFVSDTGGVPPPLCIFDDEPSVQIFQYLMTPETRQMGGIDVTLQKAAMIALLAAQQDALKKGLVISPRGGPAATRSYAKTLELWRSRVDPGLRHWVSKREINRSDADKFRQLSIRQQVYAVLDWERRGLWFSKDLSKSILYSVAVPGASQHIFMLALDIEQFGNKQVRQILADHYWFQTVKSDLPHFTYLGIPEKDLPSRGLKREIISGHTFWIPDM